MMRIAARAARVNLKGSATLCHQFVSSSWATQVGVMPRLTINLSVLTKASPDVGRRYI